MNSLKDKLAKIASYSSSYVQLCEKEKSDLGISKWSDILDSWWLGALFFFGRAFYQGRRDSLSDAYRLSALQALESALGKQATSKAKSLLTLYNKGFLDKDQWDRTDNDLTVALDKKYQVASKPRSTGKRGDKLMVLDFLRFICVNRQSETEPLNFAKYVVIKIKQHETKKLVNEIKTLYQVGPKICSFLLRDVVCFLELSEYICREDYQYLLPVDTWVRQVARRIGIEGSDLHLPRELADACSKCSISPIAFNQGAWYLGAKAFDILFDNLDTIKRG